MEINFLLLQSNLKLVKAFTHRRGGMTWMTDNFTMETNVKGGMMKGLGRMLTGESLFMATYTARAPKAELTLASSFPGAILPIELDGSKTWIAQKSSFLCATPGVELSTYVSKFKVGLFGGEGFLLQKLAGRGIVFLEIDGTLVEKELQPGERIKVDTGNVAAFESTVKYEVETVKGFTNILFGGEGLFLTVLEGPGKVYLQTVNVSGFAARLKPFLPAKG
ncbi:MAG TPA: TIGR00266 family protein [Anaerolineaceae bacterium]|nr:TIGR00266 family protein [Anaerolineaceae bacterium]HQH58270.1 TIGR00266 family protein [Anaerolineaceae bacterium]HQK03289.1 TIGR00266 family protein [Anaerolineaceae bacterium]